jgi:hypothetical protein
MELIMILINRINTLFVLYFFIGAFLSVSAAEATGNHHNRSDRFDRYDRFDRFGRDEHNEHLVLKLDDTGFMYPMEVPGMEEGDDPMPAMCFDLDVIDLKRNKIIGTGTDCMSNVAMDENGNVALIGTSYFYLPGGKLITRGAVTVQPVPEDFSLVSADGHPYSHITGSASTSEQNSIIGGTGKYENSTGRVRLSGMVDMTEFTMNEGDPLTFSCLFVLDINLN